MNAVIEVVKFFPLCMFSMCKPVRCGPSKKAAICSRKVVTHGLSCRGRLGTPMCACMHSLPPNERGAYVSRGAL